LIANAGSLENLAKTPASTVQILGAEKALFKALKAKGETPKYGLVFHKQLIGENKEKGKISRYLANKLNVAKAAQLDNDELSGDKDQILEAEKKKSEEEGAPSKSDNYKPPEKKD